MSTGARGEGAARARGEGAVRARRGVAPGSAGARLLLLAARAAGDRAADTEAAALAAAVADWDVLVAAARRHRLAPLLAYRLRAARPPLPGAAREALDGDAAGSAARGARLDAALGGLAAAFRARGVRALPFKGAVLARMAYPEPWLRRYDDLDFFVDAGGREEAGRVLRERGFRPHLDLSPGARAVYRWAGWDDIFTAPCGRYSVELTTRLVPRHAAFDFPLEALRARAVRVEVAGAEVETLALPDLLLFLAVHGAKHRWSRLAWLADFAALLARADGGARRALAGRARALGAGRAWLLAVELARRHAGALPTPGEGTALGRDGAVARLAAETERGWWRDGGEPGHVARLGYHLRVRERLRDRVRHAALLAVTPSYGDWRRLSLPAAWAWVYWVARPPRLALAVPAGLFRRARRPSRSG